MLHHLAGAAIQVANLVNYNCHLQGMAIIQTLYMYIALLWKQHQQTWIAKNGGVVMTGR